MRKSMGGSGELWLLSGARAEFVRNESQSGLTCMIS